MEKKVQPKQILVCPHCKAEYLPGEVLYPEQVLGQPTNVIKDCLGKILYNEWREDNEPLAEDIYYCDHCGKPFVIEIETSYKVKTLNPAVDFTTDKVSLI